MNKVFLYLYPIKDYFKTFLLDDEYYQEHNRKNPLPILNECIEKRYRSKGYQVVFLLYPDTEVFGINIKKEDKIIYTDISFETFKESSMENGILRYPNEELIISQLGHVDELIVGGYHYSDCVKKVAEKALELGIPSLVDLDMTDLFFKLYYNQEYFVIDDYDFERYKELWLKEYKYAKDPQIIENSFIKMYNSPVYGPRENESKKIK